MPSTRTHKPPSAKRFFEKRPTGIFALASKTALPAILILILMPLLLSCSDSQLPEDTVPPAAVLPESFTFFDLGINSRLNKTTRAELGDQLGRDAIEHRSIMDLEINYSGFLKKHFPVLHDLNRSLNSPYGERVEHNTVKLMYRYAVKKNMPFDYVELVFSNYTLAPMLFKIYFRQDDTGIINTLESKYGPPQVIAWPEENGQSVYWINNSDFLIASQVPDQFGDPRYQIVIYFTRNLEQLLAAEEKERQEKERQRARSGKTAF